MKIRRIRRATPPVPPVAPGVIAERRAGQDRRQLSERRRELLVQQALPLPDSTEPLHYLLQMQRIQQGNVMWMDVVDPSMKTVIHFQTIDLAMRFLAIFNRGKSEDVRYRVIAVMSQGGHS